MLLGTEGGRVWALLGGVDMGVVINLKLGHCKDKERHGISTSLVSTHRRHTCTVTGVHQTDNG